jgi:hypothetical protein
MEEKPPPATTVLEKVRKDREARLAQRSSDAALERIALEDEAEVARLKTPTGGSGVVNQPEDPEAKRKELINQAVVLLNNGVDPKIVGQILSGSTQIPITIPAAPGADGGALGILKTLVDSLLVNQKSAEVEVVKVQLKALEDKIAAKGTAPATPAPAAPPLSPAEVVQQSTAIVRGLHESWTHLGLIPSGAPAGQSIEELKEANRHKEKMEELGADREHKEALAEIAGDIPGRIGEGYAKHMMQQAGKGGGTGGGAGVGADGLQTFKCVNPKCGAPVVVPREHGAIVFCGACGLAHKDLDKEKGAQGNG